MVLALFIGAKEKSFTEALLMKKFALGLDLGGTKLAAALVRSDGKVLEHIRISILEEKVNPKTAPKKIIYKMIEVTADFKKKYPEAFKNKNFAGVGLASTGPLNVEKGTLNKPSNFPGWNVVPICKLLQAELKKIGITKKIQFQNDAMASAIAEGAFGAAKKNKNFAVVTMGTGVGTGIIFNGKPAQFGGMGSEWGNALFMSADVKDSQDLFKYSFEGMASGTGILLRAQAMGFEGHTIEELVKKIEAGDVHYRKLFDDAADALAALCYNLSIGFNLEKILFSGGLIKIQYLYFERLKAHYNFLINLYGSDFKSQIQVAKCGNQAGVVGAAALAFKC